MEEIEFPLTVDNLNSNLKLGRIRQQKGFLLNNTFYLWSRRNKGYVCSIELFQIKASATNGEFLLQENT